MEGRKDASSRHPAAPGPTPPPDATTRDKKDIDDPRESPAFEVLEELLHLGAEVSYHDPHIPRAPRMRSWPELPPMESQPLTPETLAALDAVVLITDHTSVDYVLVGEHADLVVDTRGVFREPSSNIVKA